MFSRATKSGRLRLTGAGVLALGIVVAIIYYIVEVRRPADDLNALLPRYERDMRHDIGVQQGTLGLILLDWQETLAQPLVRALLIVGGSAIVAGGFFRAAWVIDDDERERREAAGE